MEQNKIESQIKDKLNSREIQPSEMSWDRLDAMLSVAEEKKIKKSFGWFKIAASIVVILGIGFFLLNGENKTQNSIETTVVTNAVNKDTLESKSNEKIIPFVKEKQDLVLIKKNYSRNKQEVIVESKVLNKLTTNYSQPLTNYSQQTTSNSYNQATKSYKYITPENLLAEVQTGEKLTSSDSKITIKSKIKVDANSLLTAVEKEIDNTYKETTLDKLNRKFQDAKSALANRNYE